MLALYTMASCGRHSFTGVQCLLSSHIRAPSLMSIGQGCVGGGFCVASAHIIAKAGHVGRGCLHLGPYLEMPPRSEIGHALSLWRRLNDHM